MMQNPKGTFKDIILENIHVYNCDTDGTIGRGEGDYQAISFRGNVENMRLSDIRVDAPVRDGISLYQHRFNRWNGLEVTRCYINNAIDKIHGIHSGGLLLGGDRQQGAMEPKDNIHIHHNVIHGCAGYGMRIKAFPSSSRDSALRVWHNFSYDNGRPDEMYGVNPIPPEVNDYLQAATRLKASIIASTPG
jgi:hypothetical protein